MKKEIIKDFGNMTGYISSIGLVGTMLWILYRIKKYGRKCFNEPSPIILYSEIGIVVGSIGFLSYKLIKSIYNQHQK